MKMKNIYIAMLLSLVITPAAFADNTGKTYVAVDAGAATYANSGSYPSKTNIVSLTGGYYINHVVAIELGYTKFADIVVSNSTVNTTLTASAIHVAAVGVYPLSNQFDLTGKLGVTMNAVKDAGGFVSGSSSWNNSYSKASLMYGIGAQYHMTRQFSVRGQYENFGDMTGTSTALTSSAISVGVVYNF